MASLYKRVHPPRTHPRASSKKLSTTCINPHTSSSSQEDFHHDGKIERTFRSGRCEIIYANRTRKEILPNGVQTVLFANGDIKQTGVDRCNARDLATLGRDSWGFS